MGYIKNIRNYVGHEPILTAGVELFVFNDKDEILLQLRSDYNCWGFPGGSMELGETFEDVAIRELQEETGITNKDIVLTNIMNFQYKVSDMELEVYAGKLNKDVKLIEEINKLYWMDKKENFFDIDKFAGEGNIGHMVQQVEIYKNKGG